MPPLAHRPDWDIFCAVVDNYGDIGVSWRLARQLAAEYRLDVRLWVDDLQSFKALCPEIDTQRLIQRVSGVEIRRWEANFPETIPGNVVIEAFGCAIPEGFVTAMARCQPPPVWINLEYLSAESWVSGCHTLSSPHLRLPLAKYFFFPGFTPSTGGLLRESDLLTRRQHFQTSLEQQHRFWDRLGLSPPLHNAFRISFFAYENPAILDLLQVWEKVATPVCCLIPVSSVLPLVNTYCGSRLTVGDVVQRGSLEIRILPFVQQSDYDTLLWACDLNFVRGEDSFVRAQWAAKPMIWHIYPQQENAHKVKLDAFLDTYCHDLPAAVASALGCFWQAWNSGYSSAAQWNDLASHFSSLQEHAVIWSATLAKQEDLSSALVRFCRSKV